MTLCSPLPRGGVCSAYSASSGQHLARTEHRRLLGPSRDAKLQFKSCGESGIGLSNLLPNLQTVADDMCFVRTVHTEQFNHAPAQMFMQTGFARFGRPSMGSWVNYGLGSENENLPGFVVMTDARGRGLPKNHAQNWGSGFLPSKHAGVAFRAQGDPVLFLSNPGGDPRTSPANWTAWRGGRAWI